MESTSVIPLIYNAALLVSLVLIYSFHYRRALEKSQSSISSEIGTGVILGTAVSLIMLTPWELASGYFFDTRSILMAISGLFFGFIPTVIATIMGVATRLYEGGGGIWVGSALVINSATLGLIWRRLYFKTPEKMTFLNLWCLGFLVHALMMSSMFFLPTIEIALDVISHMAFPALGIFPFVLALIGQFLKNIRASQLDIEARLKNEFLFKSQFNLSGIGIAITSTKKNWLQVNPSLVAMLGYSEEELKQKTWLDITHPDDLNAALVQFEKMLSGEMDRYELDRRFLHKDGSIVYTHMTMSCSREVSSNEVEFFIATFVNMTEKVKAEQDHTLHQKRFLAIFEQSPIGIAVIDSHTGKFLNVNSKYAEIVGISASEMRHIDWMSITDPEDVQKDLANMAKVNAGEISGFSMEKRYLRPDGKKIWIDLTVSSLQDESNTTLTHLAMISDITDRKASETAIKESEAAVRNKLKILLEPDSKISDLELADIIDVESLQSLMDDFYKLTGMLGAVLDIKGNILIEVGSQDKCSQFHWCYPENAKNCRESDAQLAQEIDAGSFKAYRCKNNTWDMVMPLVIGEEHVGNVLIGQFFYKDEVPDREQFREQARQYDFDEEQYLSALDKVPRFSKQEVEHGMNFYAKLAEMISSLSFSSLKLAKLVEEGKRKESELKKSFEGTINSIALAVEARDPYTAGHQMRVANIAVEIATEMGMDSHIIEGIRWGAMIHDIGKINVPAEILSKPSRLTDIEFSLIKTHAEVGYNIIKDVDFPWPIANIAYQHHERIDGSGYPQGLKGHEICIEARIVAVADILEAIASHRPYRPALGVDKAIDEITLMRGKSLDAEVVDACIKTYKAGKISLVY